MKIIIPFIAISGLIHIWADHHHRHKMSLLFKPLTMVLIISILIGNGFPNKGFSNYIFFGLLFSLVGDVMLLKPWYKFKMGLSAFFISHIFYIFGFVQLNGFNWEFLHVLPFIGIGLWLYWQCLPNLGRDKIPVAAYICVILIMVWQGTTIRLPEIPMVGVLTGLGSFIFCVSDGLLAYNRYKQPFKYSNILVLGTYYIAQSLIAFSVNVYTNT